MFVKRVPFYTFGYGYGVHGGHRDDCHFARRTHGLGLITKPLIEDLQISETTYAQINLWTSLIGALFCFPMGLLIVSVHRPVMFFSVVGWKCGVGLLR